MIKYSESSVSNSFSLNDYIQFTLMADAYSIDDFKTKLKAAVLQQNWNAPQIRELKLIIQEKYTVTTYITFFIVLGVTENYLKKFNKEKSLIFSEACETSLDTLSFPNSLSLYVKQINRIKNEVDEQPSRLLAWMQVSDYRDSFTPVDLVLQKLDIHHCHLDFKHLDKNNNPITQGTFYLQLLN